LDLLQQRASHFYGEGSRYWFDTQPGIGRKVADYAESLRDRPEDVWLEITDRIRSTETKFKGSFAAVQVAPTTSADIPDTEDARLLILGPAFSHTKNNVDSEAMSFILDAGERRGTAMRANRNMLVFLAPDSKRLEELMNATRQLMGWRWMSGRYEEENLTPNSQRQVETNLKRSDEDVTRRISETYHWVIAPTQPDPQSPSTMTIEKADGSQERLAERVSDRLARSGMLVTQIGSRNIRMELESKLHSAWQTGHMSLGDLWSYYCRYPYLTRLRDRRVLDDAVKTVLTSIAADTDGFALAEYYDEKLNRYAGLVIPSGSAQFGQLMDSTLLVDIELANAQFIKDDPTSEVKTGDEIEIKGQVDVGSDTTIETVSSKSRYFGVADLDPERNARDFGRISTEVLAQLLAIDGVQVEVTVEIRANMKDGFSDDKIRIVSENARTLRFKQSGFEQA